VIDMVVLIGWYLPEYLLGVIGWAALEPEQLYVFPYAG